nr:hypothetical protein [Clostridium formicaceticum]
MFKDQLEYQLSKCFKVICHCYGVVDYGAGDIISVLLEL